MRRTLGRQLVLGDVELRVDAESLTSDVGDFLAGSIDPSTVEALYAGPFLDGFHLPGATEFVWWMERERDKLASLAAAGLEASARAASSAGDHEKAIEAWRRRVALDPLRAAPAIELIEALVASGDRAAAMNHVRLYATLVRSELGIDPDSRVTAYLETLRHEAPDTRSRNGKARSGPPTAQATHPPLVADEPAIAVEEALPTPVQRGLLPRPAALLAIVVAIAGALSIIQWNRAELPPLLAVGDVRVAGREGLTSEYTLTDMLATSIARLEGVDVLSNARVQEVLAARRRTDSSTATVSRAAADAGAKEVLEGTVRELNGRLHLDLRRVDLESGEIRKVYRVEGADQFELADAATAAIAQDFRIRNAPTALRSVTTSSLTAYRLYEQGLRVFNDGDVSSSYSLFSAALAEDSLFPMAAYYQWRSASIAGLRQEPQAYERLRRVARRAPERERLFIQGTIAAGLVDVSALAIAETLAIRYPNEPQAHLLLASVRATTGNFSGAIDEARRVRRMDSFVSDSSPSCRACEAFDVEVLALVASDSLAAAERVTREWMRRSPRALSPRFRLADVLERAGRTASAESSIVASDSLRALPRRGDPRAFIYRIREGNFARIDDRLRSAMDGSPSEEAMARWLLLISLRNQGRFAEALALASSARSASVLPEQALGHALFEAGRRSEAVAFFDSLLAVEGDFRTEGMRARSRTWALAHLATALAASGDTVRLAAVAADLEKTGARSLYGRDRKLHHYARGMLLSARGHRRRAVVELRASISSPTEGFTRASYELGRLLLAQGSATEAVAVLAPALRGSIDASNYYITRTELHELLAMAHDRAGSRRLAAAEYRATARAWAGADAPFRLRGEQAARRAAELAGAR